MNLITGIKLLRTVFKKYRAIEAHNYSHKILKEIALDHGNIIFAFKYFLENNYQDISKTSITSDFIVPLYKDSHLTLELGVFSPLIDNNTDYAYAMMHNHGNTILSTINVFGEGYDTIVFEKGHSVNPDHSIHIVPKIFKKHSLGNVEIIEENTAHVVFYPQSLTITFTLWSSSLNKVSRILEKVSERKLIKKLRIKHGIDNPGYVLQDHFYPENGSIYRHPFAIQAKPGKNFFHNFCYKLQQIRFDDYNYLNQIFKNMDESILDNRSFQDLINGQKLEISHVGDEMITPKRNPHLNDFRKVFGNIEGLDM